MITEVKFGPFVFEYDEKRREVYVSHHEEAAAMVEVVSEEEWLTFVALKTPIVSDHFCLCAMCGNVTPQAYWTLWKANPDEAAEDAVPLVPVAPGDYDPVERCPSCGWDHRDTDDGSGVWQGTLVEMLDTREAEAADMAWDGP